MGFQFEYKENQSIVFNKQMLDHQFIFNNDKIDTAQIYKYLGVEMHCLGSFKMATHNLCVTGLKVMFKLTKSITDYSPSGSLQLCFTYLMVKPVFCLFVCSNWYSRSTSFLEYQAGGGKGLVNFINQLTLERCHSF